MWALVAIVVWALFFIVLIWSEVARQPRAWRPGQGDVPAFELLPAARGSAFGSFTASLTLHLLAVVCVPYLPRLLPPPTRNQIRARLIPPSEAALILRLPDRVYMVATVAPQAEPKPSPASPRPPAAPAKPRQAAHRAAPNSLPPVPAVLLQPNRPVSAEIRSLQLPTFLYRSANQVPPPPKPIDPASAPTQNPGAAAQQRAVISPPNSERRSAAISMTSSPRASPQTPALPVSPASGPWALIAHGASPEELEGMAQRIAGDLVAVGALSATQSGRRETVEVPPVNQPATASSGQPNEGRGGASAGEQAATRAAAPAAAGNNPGSSAGAGAHTDSAPAVRILNTRGGPVEVREFADGSQQWRFSSTGTFDVVVVQHSASMIPEAQSLLTGWPVQTVFLALGTAKDWILQYCLPASATGSATQAGMVVTLGKPPKLDAPFIQLAMLPPPKITNGPLPALFAGMLGADGRFRKLRAVAAPDFATRSELLPYLEQWQFRPARWDGAFAEVEVVLFVPAATGG